MKKNNLFMLAYIIFIFICAIVKLGYDYPMWNHVVAAITVTSWIFSVCDVLQCYVVALREQAEKYEGAVELALFRIDNIIYSLSRQSQRDTQYVANAKKTVDKCEKRYKILQSTIEHGAQNSKKLGVITNLLWVVSFILFFCILVFEPVFEIVAKHLDVLTVIAFGLVLFAQFLGAVLSDLTVKHQKDLWAMNEALDALQKSYKLTEVNNSSSEVIQK